MDRIKVTSSHVEEIGYDPESKTLEVQFVSGSVYHYFDVPKEQYEALMSASSHGRYLNTIKAAYRCEKVTDDTRETDAA